MITEEEVFIIHNTIITSSKNTYGIRDIGGLKSALSRPLQTFDGKDLYITIFEKAAAIIESIIMNHPFVKGNKRTAIKVIRRILEKENYRLNISEGESFIVRTKIAQGNMPFEEIVLWLKNNTISF